jgi:hypothetical protein
MARRVIIDSNASSPLRIAVAGVDAATAQFNALIFDGNQPPLRLWGTGYVLVSGTTYNQFLGGKNTSEATASGSFPTPAGTTPVFMVMTRLNDGGVSFLQTPTFAGSSRQNTGGGAICSGSFIGVSFAVGAPGAPDALPPQNYSNYCIFKNYN